MPIKPFDSEALSGLYKLQEAVRGPIQGTRKKKAYEALKGLIELPYNVLKGLIGPLRALWGF